MQAAPVYPKEFAIAEEILEAIPAEMKLDRETPATIIYRLRRKLGQRLGTIVFSKDSLRNLASDRLRDVKIEYLRRDIERSLTRRAVYRYPRTSR